MLRALCERGIMPDLLVGSSIGAVNAAFFAGQPTLEGTYLAAEMWRTVATKDVFPKGRLHGSWRFVERREAVYPIEGLRRLVHSFLRFERLEDSVVPLTVVVTRLDDGVEEWLTEGPALEAVVASAALPAIFPAVEREGSRYIDGGVVDNTPLSVALAAGARRIYVLLCGGVNSRLVEYERPYEAMLVAFGLSIRTRLRRDLAAVPDDVDVVVLEQSGVEEILWQDFSHTEELLERGYLDARVVLDRTEAQIAERRGTRLGTRWWSRTSGRPPLPKKRTRVERPSS
jgi:NTE family protein